VPWPCVLGDRGVPGVPWLCPMCLVSEVCSDGFTRCARLCPLQGVSEVCRTESRGVPKVCPRCPRGVVPQRCARVVQGVPEWCEVCCDRGVFTDRPLQSAHLGARVALPRLPRKFCEATGRPTLSARSASLGRRTPRSVCDAPGRVRVIAPRQWRRPCPCPCECSCAEPDSHDWVQRPGSAAAACRGAVRPRPGRPGRRAASGLGEPVLARLCRRDEPVYGAGWVCRRLWAHC